MTQLKYAREGTITPQMEKVAKQEDCDPEYIRSNIADGTIVIPFNIKRSAEKVCGIGKGLTTKVNANIGTSADLNDIEEEISKLKAAEDAGADTVMDLSTGGDLRSIRKRIVGESRVTLGSVPIYEAVVTANFNKRSIHEITPVDLIDAVKKHCEDGIDFVTIHSGITLDILKVLKECKRICGVVSRGGSFLVEWMSKHNKENPYYEQFDEILSILYEYDVTLSLGDGMRPGALADAFDRVQIHELNVLAELARRAKEKDVQVIIEGPGHVPINQIQSQIQMQKELCKGAPFYVLGPIVTDIAPGYDHITAAIGGAMAASYGADFLCYVTPTEHLSLPKTEHVREGVIVTKIAAHAADLAKGIKSAWKWDNDMSKLRRKRDWEGQLATCIDPEKARKLRATCSSADEKVCSMCADLCVFKTADEE
ncbi:MAG: phosphomethylpyrimidine synthase ThiC [Candidatus Anammoxibacter sp.]